MVGVDYKPPCGPRFSQIYVDRPSPCKDSMRLRIRVAALFEHAFEYYTKEVYQAIERRVGVDLGYIGGAHDISKYLKAAELRDFLDSITVIATTMLTARDNHRISSDHHRRGAAWISECQSIFIEENVGFRVSDAGLVVPLVDTEYHRNLSTTLAGLNSPYLSAVRVEAERAMEDLDSPSPDNKGAVRSMFEAIEIYAKLAIRSYKVARLDRNVVIDHLLPLVQSRPNMDDPAKLAAEALAKGLCEWIKGAHYYHHGQNVTEPAPPPLDLAVAYVSTGASYLRWLVENTGHHLDAAERE